MASLRIGNKRIEYSKYLTRKELSIFSLSLKDKLMLFFIKHISIGEFKPRYFTAPVEFYLLRDKDRYFISYRQGYYQGFYAPEED